MSRYPRITAPSGDWERRAPATLALVTVAVLHLFAARWIMEARSPLSSDANTTKVPHRPLVVALRLEALPLSTQPLEHDSARLANNHTAPTTPPTSASARPSRPTPAARIGKREAPSADAPANRPSTVPEPIVAGSPIDWQRELGRVSEPGRPQYLSSAARAAAATGSSTQQHPSAPDESPLQKEAARAAKTDCRANYVEMGLLAIPMLARDALSQSGCRW